MTDPANSRAVLAAMLAQDASPPAKPEFHQSFGPAGLAACDGCGTSAAPRGDHYSVHFPTPGSTRPCPRSWPPKAKAKP